MSNQQGDNRWYATKEQLKDPEALERSFRRLLTMHYDLLDAHRELKTQIGQASSNAAGNGGGGPADTTLLGLPVGPVDTRALPNGALLRWVASKRMFIFS